LILKVYITRADIHSFVYTAGRNTAASPLKLPKIRRWSSSLRHVILSVAKDPFCSSSGRFEARIFTTLRMICQFRAIHQKK